MCRANISADMRSYQINRFKWRGLVGKPDLPTWSDSVFVKQLSTKMEIFMTSDSSNKRHFMYYLWPLALLIGLAICFADTALEIIWAIGLGLFLGFKDHSRHSSLRQRDDGGYVWVEWHGGERTSMCDPSQPGGQWDSEGDGGDGGD